MAIRATPEIERRLRWKRMLDLALSVLLAPVLVPTVLVAAIWVLIANGRPAFYRQSRVGKDGRPFPLLKIRTMYNGSLPVRAADGTLIVGSADGRLIPGGSFLRRTSIDELPQVLNVVSGQMSWVGPRPELEEHQAHLPPEYAERLSVLPGITGLAQVLGRNDVILRNRRRLDVFYARRTGVRLDLWILGKTLWTVLGGSGHRRAKAGRS